MLPLMSSLGFGLSASLKVCEMQSKGALIESLLISANLEEKHIPCLRAEAKAPSIWCFCPLEKASRRRSPWTPMDNKYNWYLHHKRACFSLVLCTTPLWMADLVEGKSAKSWFCLGEGWDWNQRVPGGEHENYWEGIKTNHWGENREKGNPTPCWSPLWTTGCNGNSHGWSLIWLNVLQ